MKRENKNCHVTLVDAFFFSFAVIYRINETLFFLQDFISSIFPISVDEENKNVMQNRNETEGKILANNFDRTNKNGIFDSEYRIKKLTEKQQHSVKESLAAESLVTLQTSKEENELLQSSKDQRTQNKKNEKTKQKAHNEQNQADKENHHNLNTKNMLPDQLLYDMFIKSGLTMEDVLKFKEDSYKNQKVTILILHIPLIILLILH